MTEKQNDLQMNQEKTLQKNDALLAYIDVIDGQERVVYPYNDPEQGYGMYYTEFNEDGEVIGIVKVRDIYTKDIPHTLHDTNEDNIGIVVDTSDAKEDGVVTILPFPIETSSDVAVIDIINEKDNDADSKENVNIERNDESDVIEMHSEELICGAYLDENGDVVARNPKGPQGDGMYKIDPVTGELILVRLVEANVDTKDIKISIDDGSRIIESSQNEIFVRDTLDSDSLIQYPDAIIQHPIELDVVQIDAAYIV